VAVSATGGTAPYSYQLTVDGTNVPGAGPTFSWITTTSGNGSHSLKVTVTDARGKTATTGPRTVTVSNTTEPPPSPGADTLKLMITSPKTSTSAMGTSWVVLWLEGTTSASNTYTLMVNGREVASMPNSSSRGPISMAWDSTKVPNGPQTITARVLDSTGKTASASVTVNVSNPTQ
jgi:hypothetical protein